MPKSSKIIARKCWIYERQEDCDHFRFRGNDVACGTPTSKVTCADRMQKNDRVKLKGP